MSFQAMTWAVAQDCGSPTAKLVLMMLSNHANGHTGQCNPRHKLLALECCVTVETLKTNLKRLESLGFIRIISQFKDGVQLPNHYELCVQGGGVKNSPGGGVEFSGGGGVEFSPPYNQELEPGKKPIPAPLGEPDGFKAFWDGWPKSLRKGSKANCLSIWLRKKYEDQTQTILAHVSILKTSEDWTKDGGKFIPAPMTYLNQRRWDGNEGQEAPSKQWAGAI